MILDELLVQRVINRDSKLIDVFAEEATYVDEEMCEAFGDAYPSFMEIQRTKQAKSSKIYRKEYFEEVGNPIKGFLGQIEKQVDKVYNSDEFKVLFTKNSKLKDRKEDAETYFTEKYYNGVGLIKSFQDSTRRRLLLEGNAVLAVIPNEGNSYPEPYHVVIPATNVIFYRANEIAVLRSEKKVDVFNYDGSLHAEKAGVVYYIFDKEHYVVLSHNLYDRDGLPVFEDNTVDGKYRKHNCLFMPAKKIGTKLLKETEDGHELRTTDLSDSLVFLKQAMMAFGDMSVELNLHTGSIMWTKGFEKCDVCMGTGKVRGEGVFKNGKPQRTDCDKCHGGLKNPFSGDNLEVIVIPNTTSELGDTEKVGGNLMGYVNRDITPLKAFTEMYEKHLSDALRPFGLEHLLSVPYNQSGSSKSYDMQEGYSFIRGISNHIHSLLSMYITAVVNMRYGALPQETKVFEAVSLTTPKNFNLSSTQTLFDQLKDANTYNFTDSIKYNLQRELIERQFGKKSEEYKRNELKINHDPMPSANYNQKLLSRSFLSDELFILTTNFEYIASEEIQEDPNFLNLDLKTQKIRLKARALRMADAAKKNIESEFTIKSPINVVGENQTN